MSAILVHFVEVVEIDKACRLQELSPVLGMAADDIVHGNMVGIALDNSRLFLTMPYSAAAFRRLPFPLCPLYLH